MWREQAIIECSRWSDLGEWPVTMLVNLVNSWLYFLMVTTRVISSGDLYCCLLPQCEALRTCRSGFPIATVSWNIFWLNPFYPSWCMQIKVLNKIWEMIFETKIFDAFVKCFFCKIFAGVLYIYILILKCPQILYIARYFCIVAFFESHEATLWICRCKKTKYVSNDHVFVNSIPQISRCAASFWWISRLGPAVMSLPWFRLAHIRVQAISRRRQIVLQFQWKYLFKTSYFLVFTCCSLCFDFFILVLTLLPFSAPRFSAFHSYALFADFAPTMRRAFDFLM